MDKKQLIKTIITVAPVFLVPLIVERKRIKDHPDVKKQVTQQLVLLKQLQINLYVLKIML